MDKFAISKKSILYIIIGVLIMILGFILLSGGGAESPDVYNYDLFNVRRLYIAPICILAGIVFIIVAILKRKKK